MGAAESVPILGQHRRRSAGGSPLESSGEGSVPSGGFHLSCGSQTGWPATGSCKEDPRTAGYLTARYHPRRVPANQVTDRRCNHVSYLPKRHLTVATKTGPRDPPLCTQSMELSDYEGHRPFMLTPSTSCRRNAAYKPSSCTRFSNDLGHHQHNPATQPGHDSICASLLHQ